MQKTIDEAINETAKQIADVINGCGLPLAVIKLIMTNTLLSLQQIPEAPANTEEAKDGES
jgi:hypothetical protein